MIGIVCAFFHTEGKGFYSKQARQILEQAAALFASGTMTNEDKTIFMDEMTRLYLASKRTEENGKKK